LNTQKNWKYFPYWLKIKIFKYLKINICTRRTTNPRWLSVILTWTLYPLVIWIFFRVIPSIKFIIFIFRWNWTKNLLRLFRLFCLLLWNLRFQFLDKLNKFIWINRFSTLERRNVCFLPVDNKRKESLLPLIALLKSDFIICFLN